MNEDDRLLRRLHDDFCRHFILISRYGALGYGAMGGLGSVKERNDELEALLKAFNAGQLLMVMRSRKKLGSEAGCLEEKRLQIPRVQLVCVR